MTNKYWVLYIATIEAEDEREAAIRAVVDMRSIGKLRVRINDEHFNPLVVVEVDWEGKVTKITPQS